MSWIELDDGLLEHPKFVRAVRFGGSDAIFMWLGLRAHCARHLTDGEIEADLLEEVRGPRGKARERALSVLRDVGLLETHDGSASLWMHDYLEWSSSRDDVLARREKARERKARSREPSRRDSDSDDARTDDDVTPGVTNPRGRDPLPSPLPTTSTPLPDTAATAAKGSRERRSGTWRRIPADWQPRPEELAWAQAHWLDIDSELAKLRDHEFAKPRTDPDATCRTWLRTAWERKGSPSPRQAKLAPAEDATAKKARLDAEFAEQRRRELHAERPIGDDAPGVAAAKEHVKQAIGGLF